MADLHFMNARILSLAGPGVPRRGPAMRELGVIERGFVVVRDGTIESVGSYEENNQSASTLPRPSLKGRGEDATTLPHATVIDCAGRVLMPGFVDCHTHACWAGDRYDEFEMKLRGASYLDILNSGGGIMSTVRAVRDASEDELVDLLLLRLQRMSALGTTTVEVKSGYGLNTETELKMLRAIKLAAEQSPLTITFTFLGAHAIDPDNPRFIEQTINETLPAVAAEFPGITCDAYCEKGAWSLDDCIRYFERGASLGLSMRVHADQFNSLGMTKSAVQMNAISVDHLEASTTDELQTLANSNTMGVMLPACGFHLDDRYAPGRSFIDTNGSLALATNYNPGSAPTPSMPFVLSLAARKLGLTFAEAIAATTINAAHALRMDQTTGSIEPGKRADLQLLDCADERELSFGIAGPGPLCVMAGGRMIHDRRNSAGR